MKELPRFLRLAVDNGSADEETGVVVLTAETVRRLASEFDLTPNEFLQMIEDSRAGCGEPMPPIVVK